MSELLAYVLASMGLTVLIVWPKDGPAAWVRERLLRRVLPPTAGRVLDCYICCSFWCAMVLSPIWWWHSRDPWCWAGCLMVPAVFWVLLREHV